MGKFVDLTGKRFGRLTVIERVEDNFTKSGNRITMWKCRCDCGNTTTTRGNSLKRGNTKSCGCLNREPKRFNDLTGMRFGRLTVISRAENKHRAVAWNCKCDCGNMRVIKADSLTSGVTKSCGCYSNEIRKTINYKHGKTKTRLHRIWSNMKERCGNPNNTHYEAYGGRGITVCTEWSNAENGFMVFYNWALSHGYAENLTLERKDVDSGYSPENCCWITKSEQQRNKRNNVYVKINGEKKLLSDWEKDTGIDSSVLSNRIKRGVKEEYLLHKGLLRGKMIEYNGEERNLTDWCKLLGLDFHKSYRRLHGGWSIEEVFQGFRNEK